MRFIFDLTVCQPIGSSKYHGGGVYGYILYNAILKSSPNSVVAYVDKSRYIPVDILAVISHFNANVIDSNSISLLELYQSGSYSFVYSPLYQKLYEKLVDQGVKMIVTFHGLRALEMNRDIYEYMYANSLKDTLKAFLKQTVYYKILYRKYWKQYYYFLNHENVTAITISEHSRSSLIYYYPNLITRDIPIFYSPSTTTLDIASVLPFSDHSYYLLLSANRWLKNSYRAIQALDILYEKFPNQFKRTIVIGLTTESKIYKSVKHKECFEFLDYVDNEELEKLYKGAYLFIYPTLNEGFGYPPLEAMKYGIPVISSPFSSIPEICADCVFYFNPYSKDEIANRIIQLKDKELYEKYSKKSIERYKYIFKKQNEYLNNFVDYLLLRNN